MKKGILFFVIISCAYHGHASWSRLASRAGGYLQKAKSAVLRDSAGIKTRYHQFIQNRAEKDMTAAVKDVNHAMKDIQLGMPTPKVIEGVVRQAANGKTLQAGANQVKYNVGGRQTSLNIDTINISNPPKKGFWELFFGFLDKGKNGRILAAGALGGGAVGYGVGSCSTSTKSVVLPMEQTNPKFVIMTKEQIAELKH